MARRKRSRPAEAAKSGGNVINELFGRLEDDPDIESDIAQLGSDGEEEAFAAQDEKPAKSRFFFVFALFVIVMAIIGCVSTVRFVCGAAGRLLDNTSLRNEFAQFIFPVVVNDTAPFESVGELPEAAKINCAMWNILINKDTSQYGTDMLTIPEYDVMASCKEIFGSAVTVEHQTAGSVEARFTYDETNHVYTTTKSIRYLTYAPTIVEMTESSGTFTLIVGYLPPTLASVAGLNGIEVVPDKYMEYTIERWEGKNTLLSVKFSDYTPAAES